MNVNHLPVEFIHKRSTKKEGTFVSDFSIHNHKSCKSTVTYTVYKCQHLDKSTNYKYKKDILLNALPKSLIFIVLTKFINKTEQPIPRVLKIKARKFVLAHSSLHNVSRK